MKRRLSFLLVVVIVLGLFAVSGCTKESTNSSDKITITIWEDESNEQVVKTLCEYFLADYYQKYPLAPKIEIKIIAQAEASAVEGLQTAGPAGNGPDIFAFVHDTLGTAVNAGLIAENINAEKLETIQSQDALDAFTFEGVLYGYPITAESLTVMYDKSKITAEELSSFDSIKNANKKLAWTVSNTNSGYYPFGLFTDSVLFGEDGTSKDIIDLDTTKTVDNLYSFYKDYSGVIENATVNEGFSLLQTGEVAGIISSPYLWADVKNALGENAAIAVLPSINGENQRPFSGYKGYGVNRYSKNPTIAHMLADYLSGEEAQYLRLVEKEYLPTISSDRIDNYISKSQSLQVFKQSLNNSITMPNILKMGSYWSPMQDVMTELWNTRANITKDIIREKLQSAESLIKKD